MDAAYTSSASIPCSMPVSVVTRIIASRWLQNQSVRPDPSGGEQAAESRRHQGGALAAARPPSEA
jgi:hypothetical protein